MTMLFQESDYFAAWLNLQKPAAIMAAQVAAVENVIDRLSNGDLICAMYNGSPEIAMKALRELKARFEVELEHQAQLMGGADEPTWN